MATILRSDSRRQMLPAKVAKKASTVLDVGDVVISTSGQVDVAVASSVLLLGINVKKVAATDDDYASTTPIEVEAIDPNAVYEMDVVTGSAAASHVGLQYDLADETGVDLTGTTYKQVKVVGVISASKVLVKFSPVVL